MLQHQFAEYIDLYQWSIAYRAAFWQAAIESVGIKFKQPFTSILDVSHGVENPNWLAGSKLNIVDSCFKAPPSKTAIIYLDATGSTQTVTYLQLRQLANQVSNALQKLNLLPGSTIAVDMLMTVEAVAIYLGIIQAGYVAVGIADSFAAEEVAKRIEISQAQLIFTQDHIMRVDKKLPLYQKLCSVDLPPIVVISLSDEYSDLQLRADDLTWQQFLDHNNEEYMPVSKDPHDPVTILFSSGTSGEPKAIVWDHTSPIKCAVDGYFYQDIQASDIVAWPTSLGWMMGPWLVFAVLINQATIALYYDVPTTQNFLDFVVKAQVTILGVIPSLVKSWHKHNYCAGADFSSIKLFTSTGEISNPDDMSYLMQHASGAPIIEYCGGTEISGAYITSTVLQENIPGMFSTPVLGIELRLIDEHAHLVPIGEVTLVPPAIGLSRVLLNRDNYQEYYANMPVPNDSVILRRHGDKMERLNNGYYRSLGRLDDTMNLGGIKVSAIEIENCFLEIENILEVAAVSKQSAEHISELVIFVVPVELKTLDLRKLQLQMQLAINSKLNPLFKISKVMIIEQIPRTSSHKIMRRELRDLL